MKIYSKFKQILIASMTLFAGLCGACSEPEYQSKESPYQYDPDGYQVDIALLSEWAGHILPELNTFFIVHNNDNGYRLVLADESNIDDDVAETIINAKKQSQDKSRLSKIRCFECGDKCSTTGIDNDLSTICSKCEAIPPKYENDKRYICAYYTSGAANIARTWIELKESSEDVPQIHIGNGDSFGISARIASSLDDTPTALMLNTMGFNVDTFGNHSFDQQLSYIQNVVSHATYHYIASNIKNVPQNLTGVSPFYLTKLKKDATETTPPILAVVSAIDMDADSTVYPGRFGTLDIADYCEVIHAIEMAYNQGARSFLVLGHILTDSESMIAILNALFSFADDHYTIFDANQLKSLVAPVGENIEITEIPINNIKTCKSMIEIPPDRLLKEFGKSNLNKIDLTKQENIDKYNNIIKSIKREIFNGIIGIFGEGSSDPRLISFELPDESILNQSKSNAIAFCNLQNSYSSNQNLPFMPNGCKTQSYSIGDSTYSLSFSSTFINNNKLPYYNRINNNNGKELLEQSGDNSLRTISSDHKPYPKCFDSNVQNEADAKALDDALSIAKVNPCHKIQYEPDAPEKHPIWYIQLPSYGTSTAQIHVDIESNHDNTAYTSDLKTFEMRPVLAKLIDSINYNYCTSNVLSKDCKKIYTEAVSDLSKYDTCINDITKGINQNQSDHSVNYIEKIQNTFECIYQPMVNIRCGAGSSIDYREPPYFKFPMTHITDSTETQDRSSSTFRTSLATTAVLRTSDGSNKSIDIPKSFSDKLDPIRKIENVAVLINAGAIKDKDITKFNKNILRELVPFQNNMELFSISPSDLKPIIENAILSQTEKAASDFGGFPTFAGIHVSVTKNQEKNRLEVVEMWRTNRDEELVEPLLIAFKNDGNNLSAKCNNNKNKCIFADYKNIKIEGNRATVEIDQISDRRYAANADFTNLNLEIDSSNSTLVSSSKLNLLIPDYLATGGDGYDFSKGKNVLHSNILISDYINIYLGISKIIEGSKTENTCDTYQSELDNNNKKTIDKLSAADLACILSIRRYYRTDDTNQQSTYINGEVEKQCKNQSSGVTP